MGLLGWIKNQFIDVIEWLDSSNNTLVWRFPDQDQEIKNGAKLTVREGQVAIFVNEGQIGDVFPPGLYSLTTQNLPILTSLKSWKYGFNSPFKAEVYFVNTKQYMDLRWGTMNPIMMRDPDFGVVRIRAFGLYAIQVVDARTFFKELVGTDGHVTTNDVDGALKRMLVSAFTTSIASSGVPALDMAGNYEVVGARIQAKMASEFSQYGLSLRKFVIENISLPPEVEKALDTRTSMGVMGEMGRYAQFQAATAIRDAATSSGGTASDGIGLGAGLAMGQMMAQTISATTSQASTSTGPTAAGTRPCYACKAPVGLNAKFCPECGTNQNPSCPQCNNACTPGAKFCAHCGNKLGS